MSGMLSTYLQDHHAGAMVGGELAKRAASSNEETSYGAEIAEIAEEILADREALETIMEHLDVKANPLKDGVGWASEKLGRLKPNNRLTGYSPLSRVVELEGLVVGVTGKTALWESLRDTLGEQVAGVDLNELVERANRQRALLDALRRRAAAEAFSNDG